MELGPLTGPEAPERRRRTTVRAALAAAALAVIAYGIMRSMGWPAAAPGGAARVGPERVVPDSVRVRVEVFNASDNRGAARAAATYLRDAGFDVVYFGNATERRDTTVVRDRVGNAAWADWAVRTMSPAQYELQRDSTRFVDLSIYVGRLWRPPPDPFRP